MEDDGFREWELLPDDGFLQVHDDEDGNGKKIFSRRYASPHHNHLFVTNYFVFPSVRSSLNLAADPTPEVVTRPSKRVLDHLPIHLDESEADVEVEPPQPSGDLGGTKPEDETVSQVSFKKLLARENEFADMKLDSLKSICNNNSGRAALPQIDLIQYELENTRSSESTNTDHPKNAGGGGDGAGLTRWKWRAMCSFGVVAAATFCFIILGSQRKNKRGESKLQFQIFSDDKVHHKNSISMPVSKTVAHITFNFEC